MKSPLRSLNQVVKFRVWDLVLVGIIGLLLMLLLIQAIYKRGIIEGRIQATQALNIFLEEERNIADEQ